MRISTVRKALVKQSIVVVVLLCLVGGGLWYVDSLDSECDENISKLKSQADAIAKQVVDLTAELDKAIGYTAVYDEIKLKRESNMLTISKAVLRDVIAGTRSKYYSDDLDVKMDEVKPHVGDKYKRDAVFIESSGVNISLNSLSDLDVLWLVQTLQESFLGMKMTSLKLSTVRRLDSAALIAIKDNGFLPIVKGEISFRLFGLHDVNEAEKELLMDDGASPQNAGGHKRYDDGKKRIRLRQ